MYVIFFLMILPQPRFTLFPYTTLFRSMSVGRKTRSVPSALRRAVRRRDRGCRFPGCENHRSEEHTSELQSRRDLVCRLLLEKKKQKSTVTPGVFDQRSFNQSNLTHNIT